MEREIIFEYVQKRYGTAPEYLWSRYPEYAVLRCKNNKWYAIVMSVPRDKLGLEGDEEIPIIDVKCDPETISLLAGSPGFLPGYHMNKNYWITVLLDGTVREDKVLDFIDRSYELVAKKK